MQKKSWDNRDNCLGEKVAAVMIIAYAEVKKMW